MICVSHFSQKTELMLAGKTKRRMPDECDNPLSGISHTCECVLFSHKATIRYHRFTTGGRNAPAKFNPPPHERAHVQSCRARRSKPAQHTPQGLLSRSLPALTQGKTYKLPVCAPDACFSGRRDAAARILLENRRTFFFSAQKNRKHRGYVYMY